MFIIQPAGGLPIIYEVPKEKRTLEELGVRELTNIVVFDSNHLAEGSV